MARLDTVPDTRSTPERQLAVFLAAAFLLSWGTGYLTVAVLDLGVLGLGLGALVPGVVALALTRRDHGSIRPLWNQMTRWRVAPRWYAAAVGIPIALVVAATSLSTTFGAAPAEATLLGSLGFFPLALLLAGGPEEPGWRGYALPRLQHRFNAFVATMLLGCIWALWHAPLWLIAESGYPGMSYPAYFALTVGQSVIYTWLFNSTGGNVLLAMIFHATMNTALASLPSGAMALWMLAGAAWAVAAVLVAIHGPANLSAAGRIRADSQLSGAVPGVHAEITQR
jgi:uncharacterized protein